MHTATAKPVLLRAAVQTNLNVDLQVLRHEKFAQSSGDAPESVGDLIIFDMDHQDPIDKEVGNTKVFCQDASRFALSPVDALQPHMRSAIDKVLDRELRSGADEADGK